MKRINPCPRFVVLVDGFEGFLQILDLLVSHLGGNDLTVGVQPQIQTLVRTRKRELLAKSQETEVESDMSRPTAVLLLPSLSRPRKFVFPYGPGLGNGGAKTWDGDGGSYFWGPPEPRHMNQPPEN